jgi:dihydrofolate reductase
VTVVSLVAAVARGGVIGRDGGIPWRLPEDMAHFRELTMGHPVVMGRRTWESLPDQFRPLPGRGNVVVTRNPDWSAQGADRVGSLEEALDLLESAPRVFVIGGGEIYAAALPYADELLLTEIDAETEGDTVFPEWDRRAFEEIGREEHVSPDGMRFAFVSYRRWATDADGQLAGLAEIAALLERDHLDYWLFGGWAVDFYAGRVTRPHDDVDLAVWLPDVPRVDQLLRDSGWEHAPEADEDGGTGYERSRVRVELTYLVRKPDGTVVIPLRSFEATWPDGTFGDDVRSLRGVSARIVSLTTLAQGKARGRDDPEGAAKDRADSNVLSDL